MGPNAAAGISEPPSFQTVRLSVGRHDGPGAEVCVMELASMLAGERFSDRPASVCPIIGALLRAYNDNIDDERRDDLYRYAAEAVGTRGDFRLQLRRAEITLAWAGARYGVRARRWMGLGGLPREPAPDWGPDRIAVYVIGSLGRLRRKGRAACTQRGGWSDETHLGALELLDRLIELGLAGKIVEQVVEPVEHRRRDPQLLVGELCQRRAPTGLDRAAALLDELASVRRQRGQHDPLVLVGADAGDEPGGREVVEHLGHSRGGEVGLIAELPG
jgi:hypothetical protein